MAAGGIDTGANRVVTDLLAKSGGAPKNVVLH
jgi:hypothetical protein